MALPPTIPTSFVPHPTGAAPRRFRADLTGAFDFFAYGVLGFVFILALGVFLYGRVLAADKLAKDAKVSAALTSIDLETVDDFVRLRDRLTSGQVLLEKHMAFSTLFAALEKLLPATVRFTSLRLSIDSSGATSMEGSGVAKSFNALAATSAAFAQDGRIKDAIFSNITVNAKDSSVSFTLSAMLEPDITAFTP
ncbi:TPA: hypothetical protein DIV48_03330 [Candidatus Kaiserbacteria bacterium]|nr:MAG: hypothetical protein UY93_C0003G0066 [Parcubacteria group bacterium GW2011_GWA1_56_13]KKW45828.1 MAG: hypothetical protein UY97_C0014G0026 [Parcubacteria group bacterium GW2011_GWB1_57_6]HCR52645.1 hypothetical protein [Candidatus Kaiserbacteria bacterium]